MVLERASRDDVLIEVAFSIAKRGTCARAQVGAVISRDGRIISTGYNGAPTGMPHCDHECNCGSIDKWGDDLNMHDPECPHVSGCEVAGHAEENAIAYAARFGVGLKDTELHVTHAPCYACARMIVNAGIVKVTYYIPYRKTEGIELLASAGIQVTPIKNDV